MSILTTIHALALQIGAQPASLIGLALKGSLLLLAVASLALLLRGAAAATRHLLWAGAMLALVALPFLGRLLPSWSMPIAPAFPEDGVAAALAAVPIPTPRAPLPLPQALPQAHAAGARPLPAARPAPPALDRADDSNPPARAPQAPAPARTIDAGDWVTPIWLGGMLLIAARLGTGWIGLRRLARLARPVDEPAWRCTLDSLAGELAPARTIRLLRSPDRTTPMTWGILRPIILLPAGSAGWSSDRREAVLLHELAHVRRRDWLVQLVTEAACAIHWFNPLVWMGARQVRAERERACDDQVLNHGKRPCDYATHLLEIARMTRHRTSLLSASIAMARRSRLEHRLRAILDPSLPRHSIRQSQRFMLGCLIAAGALALGSWQPLAVADEDDRSEPTLSRSTGTRVEVRSSATASSGSGPGGNARAIDLTWSNDDGRSLRLEMEGDIDLNDDGTAIARIEEGASLTLEEKTAAGVRRYVAAAGEDGTIETEWTVDGVPAELDAEAEAWVAQTLKQFRPFFSGRPGALATVGDWVGTAAHARLFSEDPSASATPPDDAASSISLEAEQIVVDEDAGAVQAEGDVTIRIESSSDAGKPSVVIHRSENSAKDGSATSGGGGLDRDETLQRRMARLAEENAERLRRQLEAHTRNLDQTLDQHRRQLDKLGEDLSRRQAELFKMLDSADEQLSRNSLERMLKRQQESLSRLLEAESDLLRQLDESYTDQVDPFLDELERQVPRGLDSLQKLIEQQQEGIGRILEKEESLLELLRKTLPQVEKELRHLLPPAQEETAPPPAEEQAAPAETAPEGRI